VIQEQSARGEDLVRAIGSVLPVVVVVVAAAAQHASHRTREKVIWRRRSTGSRKRKRS
jgi:hypothetical protein